MIAMILILGFFQSLLCLFFMFFFLLSWAVRNALVVVAASLVAFSWDASGHDVFTITGKTTRGLPPFRPPPTSDTTENGTVVSFGEIVTVRSEGVKAVNLIAK